MGRLAASYELRFFYPLRRAHSQLVARSYSAEQIARQVAIAAITSDEDDHATVDFFRELQRRPARSTGTGTREKTSFFRQATRGVFCVLLRDVDDAVDARWFKKRRQVFFWPAADARDLTAFGGLAADDLHLRILFLQVTTGAMMVPVVPIDETKCVT